SSFLGKKVSSNGSSINIDKEGDDAKLRFVLKSDAPKAIIRVFDDKSNMIGQMEKENLSAGVNEIMWNGKSLDGQTAGPGKYTFQVLAHGEDYKPIEVELKTQGVVTGVEFDGENTILVVDGKRKIDLREVDSFEISKPRPQNTLKPIANVDTKGMKDIDINDMKDITNDEANKFGSKKLNSGRNWNLFNEDSGIVNNKNNISNKDKIEKYKQNNPSSLYGKNMNNNELISGTSKPFDYGENVE
ncbi:MAG: hypothetical protein HQK51_20870, partial [Oligoflexia bacterium]|nr:hypothetical protein [Oligoflexia bacterium]